MCNPFLLDVTVISTRVFLLGLACCLGAAVSRGEQLCQCSAVQQDAAVSQPATAEAGHCNPQLAQCCYFGDLGFMQRLSLHLRLLLEFARRAVWPLHGLIMSACACGLRASPAFL